MEAVYTPHLTENRSQCNNLRVMGLPNSYVANLHNFCAIVLPQAIGLKAPGMDMVSRLGPVPSNNKTQ